MRIKLITFILLLIQLTACTSNGATKHRSFKGTLGMLPIIPSNDTLLPTAKLGDTPFDPRPSFIKPILLRSKDNTIGLYPGDYIMPVMTYCMNPSAGSPIKHLYTLSKLEGTVSDIVRDINVSGIKQFSPTEIQYLVWDVIAGRKYKELSDKNRPMVDQLIPQHRSRLEVSAWEKFVSIMKKAEQIPGMPSLPKINDFSPDLSESIDEYKRAREKIITYSNDYDRLIEELNATGEISKFRGGEQNTPWSQVEPGIYARFITEENFNQLGQIQLRVLPNRTASLETINAQESPRFLDLARLQADPGISSVQPLSFSPLIGALAIPFIAIDAPPLVIAAAIYAIISTSEDDMNAIATAMKKYAANKNAEVKKAIQTADRYLNEKHDELDKPLKDAGVITDEKPTNKRNIRQYKKPGGKKALREDFDKIPGEVKVDSRQNMRYKELGNGNRIVERVNQPSRDEKLPTLEIQGRDRMTKTKVRYND